MAHGRAPEGGGDDRLRRRHLGLGHRRAAGLEAHQVPEVDRRGVGDQPPEPRPGLGVVAARHLLEGVPHLLAVDVHLQGAGHRAQVGVGGLGGPGQGVVVEVAEADAPEARGDPGEVVVDQRRRHPHRLEEPGAPVPLEGGGAHLREDALEAVLQGLEAVGLALRRGHAAGGAADLEEEPGAHGVGAGGDVDRDVVGLLDLAGLHHDRRLAAQPHVGEGLVEEAHQEQQRQGQARRRAAGVEAVDGPAVADHEDVGLAPAHLAHRLLGELGDAGGDGPGVPGAARGEGVGGVDHGGDGPVRPPGADGLELGLGEDRALDAVLGVDRVLGEVLGDEGRAAQVHREVHRPTLPDGIDGRVGDHGDDLPEVLGEDRALGAEHRQGPVEAHGREGLLALLGHGLGHPGASAVPAEEGQPPVGGGGGARRRRVVGVARGRPGGGDQGVEAPGVELAVVEGGGLEDGLGDVAGAQDAPVVEVHGEGLAGLELAGLGDVALGDGDRADSRCPGPRARAG